MNAELALAFACLLFVAVSAAAFPAPRFIATGPMTAPRAGSTGTLLPDGTFLVAGGLGPTATAELYDPVTRTWSATGSMTSPRFQHTATLLPNGKVLVAGGGNGNSLASAELYDPATKLWTATGSMASARQLHLAVLLSNGKVLVAGGSLNHNGVTNLSSSEVYDPVSGLWSAAGPMAHTRVQATAVLLQNGSVFAAGGFYDGLGGELMSMATAETFDVASGSWTATASMAHPRFAHALTLLPNGKVLITGGVDNQAPANLVSSELYDPALATWAPTGSLKKARAAHAAILLANGKVLVAGGQDLAGNELSSAEIYDPAAGTWTMTSSMTAVRAGPTSAALANGEVLVAGGGDANGAISSADLLVPVLEARPFTGLTTVGLTANWSAAAGFSGFVARLSTGALPNSFSGNRSSATDATSATFVSLSTNTRYFLQAGSADGGSSLDLGSVYTLAAPPAGTAASQVWAASVAISWSLNTNPAATWASIERSVDGAAFLPVSAASSTLFTDTGLLGCTSYYYRVRNFNGGGIATGYDSAISILTAISTPSAASALAAASETGNRISVSWTPSPSPDIVSYQLYGDGGTGTIDYAAPLAVLASSVASWTSGVMTSSAAYEFALRARNRCGSEERNTGLIASAASVSSPAGVRAAIKAPQSGKRVSGNRVTVVAEVPSAGVSQTASVLFQYRLAGAAGWTDLVAADGNHSNPDVDFPYFIHWDVTGLAPGDYDVRAVASDLAGSSDTAPSSISITVDPVNPEIDETSLGGGQVSKRQAVDNGAPTVVLSGDEGTSGMTKLLLPAGALNIATAAVTVLNNPAGLPPAPNGIDAAGIGTQITLSNGQSLLSGGQTADVVVSYPDVNGDGIVDGTAIRADRLQLYSYDASNGAWRHDFSSTLNPAARTVTGHTPHFSFFALFAPAAVDLSLVRVYPNPYKPNGGRADEGLPFAAGNPNSGVIFDNLPASATITIYTAGGRRVAEISGASGKLQWDGRGEGGRDAATGLYFAAISSPGQATVVKKILVVR